MKFKKTFAILLTGAMLLGMISVRAQNRGILQFEDDFSQCDTVKWNIRNNSMRVSDEMLISDTNRTSAGPSNAAVSADSARWTDFRTEFDFMPTGYTDESFFCVNLREGDGGAVMLLFRRGGMNYIYPGGWEKGGFAFDFSENTTYRVAIEAVGQNISISVNNNNKSVLKSIGGAPVKCGGISIGTYGLSVGIDNFKVYNLDSPKIYFPHVVEKIERGQSRKITAVCSGADSISYASSAPEIISVSENGTITASSGASGKAVITAEAVFSDGTTLTASYDAFVMVPMSGTGFDRKYIELYVGENANVRAAVRPSGANMTKLIWRNENPDCIDLVGDYNDSRGIIAKAVSDDAAVTLLDGNGRILDRYHVKVIQRPSEVKNIGYTWQCGREIPKNFFGMNSSDWLSLLASAGSEKDFDDRDGILRELIGNVNAGFTRAILEGYDWKSGKLKNQSSDMLRYGIDKVVGVTGNLNIPICLSADMSASAQDVADMVREIRKTNSQPLYLEVGNESYDIQYLQRCGTVEEFTERTRQIYNAVKAVDESVKIAVPILGYELSYMFSSANSSEYDQGMRGKTWNSYLAANPDCYDAVVIHSYSTAGLSYSGADDIMDEFSKSAEMLDYDVIYQAENLFPDKEFWITEFGDLPSYITDGSCESEKSRLQYMKSVGNAVGYVQKVLTAVENPYIKNIAYHTFNDFQGFGSVQISGGESTLLPSYYAFEQIGKLMRDYDRVFTCNTDLQDTDLFHSVQLYPNVPDVTAKTDKVKAVGFGNGDVPEKLAAVNTSAYPVRISLDGTELKQTFIYGSDNPLPDFAVKSDNFWTDLPTVIPQPTECNSDFENEIIIPPYSMTVAEVKEDNKSVVYAVAALYDENNALREVIMERVTGNSYHFNGKFSADGCTVKFFVIDGIMRPRAESLTYGEDIE